MVLVDEGRFEEAIYQLEYSILLDINDARPFWGLGMLWAVEKKDPKAGLKYLEEALARTTDPKKRQEMERMIHSVRRSSR